MPILDPVTGRPFDLAAAKKDLQLRPLPARKSVGVLDPAKIGRAIKDADGGRIGMLVEMAIALEDADWQWRTVIQKRKAAVTKLPIRIESAEDDARSEKDAELVNAVFKSPGIRRLVFDLLDGVSKGFAVCEIDWKYVGTQLLPRRYVRRDPRMFVFDKDDPDKLMWAGQGGGAPEEPGTWTLVQHRPMLTSESAARSGLARQGIWLWMFKSFGLRQWAEFLEAYGQPIRIGKWPDGASEPDKAVLKQAVLDLAVTSGVAIPQGMDLSFEHVGARADPKLHLVLLEYLDHAASKLVLGETTTTDAISGGHAVSKEHNEVRADIRDADAADIAETLARDLIRPLIDINHGPPPSGLYPIVMLQEPESADIEVLGTFLEKMVPLGLRVEQSVVLDRAGLPTPAEDAKPEDLLHPPAPSTSPAETSPHMALFRPVTHAARPRRMSRVDHMTARMDREGAPVIDAWLEEISTFIREADEKGWTLKQLQDELLALYPMLPVDELSELLAQGLVAADLLGRDEV